MRKKQTFMITVITSSPQEDLIAAGGFSASPEGFCGQIKVISSGRICNFTNLSELNQLIATEMNDPESNESCCSNRNQNER